jgi:light-regulated signal transduction histidine kinase (bacteriophytochrome)
MKPELVLSEAHACQGLGLVIVQRLMELPGGSCGFERRLEGGSSFYFTLPVL